MTNDFVIYLRHDEIFRVASSSMPSRNNGRKPTDSEMKILSVIWEHGPKTVREVHDLISQK